MLFATVTGYAQAAEWKEKSGDHFIVYYLSDEQFAKEVVRNAEEYYRSIATDLGYPRYSDFWLWEKRVKIYLFADHQSFLKASGEPSWSHGMADYTNKRIISYAWSEQFMESLLPHEIAHLIFRDFVGFKGEVPVWLDEGVSQWAERQKQGFLRSLAKRQFEDSSLLSLEYMMKLDIRRLDEHDNKVHIKPSTDKDGEPTVLFMSSEAVINAYYLQGFSLVDFLISRYGAQSFTDFCRQLRDGKGMDEAIRFSYSHYMKNLGDLEQRWRKHLREMEE